MRKYVFVCVFQVVNSLGVVLDGRLAQQQQQQRPRGTDTKTQTVAGKVAQRKHDHHKVKLSILQYYAPSVADPDPGSGAVLTPGSGIRDG
jgi:hypothetical protein